MLLIRKEKPILNEKNKYYALIVDDETRCASINIYGNITSWTYLESDVSSYNLSKEIEGLDVDRIDVYINSYGGEVAEGLAIYNSLKRHKAKITTICDGFACSIASVIFMAGDERIMNNASLLMIHNAWTYASGNAAQLRKEADDLDIISAASMKAYMEYVEITEEELKTLLEKESWLSSELALEYGFATSVIADRKSEKASQNVKKHLMKMILAAAEDPEDPKDPEEPKDPEDPEDPEEPKDPEDPEDPEEPKEPKDPEDPEDPEDQNMQMFRSFFNALSK